jgi:signal peptidase I
VNGAPAFVAPNSQTEFIVQTNGKPIPEDYIQDSLGININDASSDFQIMEGSANTFKINMTANAAENLKKLPQILSVTYFDENTVGYTFPNDMSHFPWSVDNYGPIRIPKQGDVVQLNDSTIELYRRLISNYEHNNLEEKQGKYYINGVATATYTVKENYYWMMGDNRHRSQDSRYWGYVPETHIVGRAALIWFSYSKSIRWNRLFSQIK